MPHSWRPVTTAGRPSSSVFPRVRHRPAHALRSAFPVFVFSGALLAACTYKVVAAGTPEGRWGEGQDDGRSGEYSQLKTSKQKEADNRKLAAEGSHGITGQSTSLWKLPGRVGRGFQLNPLCLHTYVVLSSSASDAIFAIRVPCESNPRWCSSGAAASEEPLQ